MISATLDSYHPAPQGPGFLVPGPRNQASERQHTTPRTRPIVIVLKCTGAIVTTLGQGRDARTTPSRSASSLTGDRDVPPAESCDAPERTDRGIGVHRGLVQQAPTPFIQRRAQSSSCTRCSSRPPPTGSCVEPINQSQKLDGRSCRLRSRGCGVSKSADPPHERVAGASRSARSQRRWRPACQANQVGTAPRSVHYVAGEFLPEKIEVNGEGHAAFRVSRLGDDLREQVGAPLDVSGGEVGLCRVRFSITPPRPKRQHATRTTESRRRAFRPGGSA